MLIAHLTDFHVTVEGGRVGGIVDTRAAFTELLSRVADLRPRPDLLIISGDLAEEGVEAEYAFVADGLGRLGIPFAAVPGNHDRRGPMRQVLGPHTGQDGGHLGLVRDMGDVRLIGLDTLVERHGHGALEADQLAFLAGALDGMGGRRALIFMHHPPFATGIAAMDAIGLRQGGAELEALLRGRSDVLAVVSGHVHRAIVGAFAGQRAFIAPAPGHQFSLDFAGAGFAIVEEPMQIALHRIGPDGLVTYLVGNPHAD